MDYIIPIHEDNLYLYLNNETRGPVTLNEIRNLFDEGEVTRATFLWFAGLENWITVGDIPEFDRRVRSTSAYNLPQFPARATDIIVALKGKPIPLKLDTIKFLIENKEFRRADLVFRGDTDQWVRGDQHPTVRQLFANPPPPNPPEVEDDEE